MNPTSSPSPTPRTRIGYGLACLLFSFLLLSFMGWLRLETALSEQALVREVQALPGVIYLAITGGVWGGLGILAVMGLLSRRQWGRRIAQASVILFPLTGWANALWTANVQSTRLTGLPFFIGLTIIWLALGLWVLLRANRKRWFNSTI